jgi:hypothetical protein
MIDPFSGEPAIWATNSDTKVGLDFLAREYLALVLCFTSAPSGESSSTFTVPIKCEMVCDTLPFMVMSELFSRDTHMPENLRPEHGFSSTTISPLEAKFVPVKVAQATETKVMIVKSASEIAFLIVASVDSEIAYYSFVIGLCSATRQTIRMGGNNKQKR